MKVKNVFTYFTDTILRRNANSYRNPRVRWAVRQYKLLFYTARGLIAHDTIVRSAALTFYTLISIVPILALVFAVVKGFGLLDGLIDDLYALFPQNVEVLDYMVEFARKALANTQGGLIALVSVVTLFWAVIRVFGSVESAFNNIWEVQSSRNIARQYLNYIVIAMVAPILWLVASTMGGYLLRFFDAGNTFLGILLSKLSALVIIWGSFTLIYAVVPNTKVLWRSAFMAGIVAGTVFMLFQWGYLYLQGWMTSYNAIYGSFAALPLFLLWLKSRGKSCSSAANSRSPTRISTVSPKSANRSASATTDDAGSSWPSCSRSYTAFGKTKGRSRSMNSAADSRCPPAS